MKRIAIVLVVLATLLTLAACDRGEGGAAGYGAGGGQSLREGSTSPLHSSIAQDQTYQQLLGMNIILYPPPIDDPKFDLYGKAHWDMDPSEFTQAALAAFSGEMGDQAVYEPKVDALQGHAFVEQIKQTIYGGADVQVGWAYGKNANLDFMETNGATVTVIPVFNTVYFLGSKADVDPTTWMYPASKAKAFFFPANAVTELLPDTMRSAPIRVADETGQLTIVIVPAGTALEAAAAGTGFDQALVAANRWVLSFAGNPFGFFAGLDGSNVNINAVD
jgi:hypothetical protein